MVSWDFLYILYIFERLSGYYWQRCSYKSFDRGIFRERNFSCYKNDTLVTCRFVSMDPLNVIIRLQVALLFETIYMQLYHTWIFLVSEYITMPTTKRTFTVEQPFLCLCSGSKSFDSMGIFI